MWVGQQSEITKRMLSCTFLYFPNGSTVWQSRFGQPGTTQHGEGNKNEETAIPHLSIPKKIPTNNEMCPPDNPWKLFRTPEEKQIKKSSDHPKQKVMAT